VTLMIPSQGELVVLTTTSGREEAERLVKTLVEENLVACGNIVGPVTSIYRWKGALCTDPEHMVILKTRKDRLEEMSARLKGLHSYECPEILVLPVEAGFEAYMRWLRENTSKGTP